MTKFQIANQNVAALSYTLIIGGIVISAAWTLIRARLAIRNRRRDSEREIRRWDTTQSKEACHHVLEEAAREERVLEFLRAQLKAEPATMPTLWKLKHQQRLTSFHQILDEAAREMSNGGSARPNEDAASAVAA